MTRLFLLLVAIALGLGACCRGPAVYGPTLVTATNSDALGRPLVRRASLVRKHAVPAQKVDAVPAVATPAEHVPTDEDLAKLKPYSKEWGAALDAMNRAADERLKRILIICRGCLPPAPADQTGSIPALTQTGWMGERSLQAKGALGSNGVTR